MKTKNGDIVKLLSADSFDEWKDCTGYVYKEWLVRMIRRFKRSFLNDKGGKVILWLSTCTRAEVLIISNPTATDLQAK